MLAGLLTLLAWAPRAGAQGYHPEYVMVAGTTVDPPNPVAGQAVAIVVKVACFQPCQLQSFAELVGPGTLEQFPSRLEDFQRGVIKFYARATPTAAGAYQLRYRLDVTGGEPVTGTVQFTVQPRPEEPTAQRHPLPNYAGNAPGGSTTRPAQPTGVWRLAQAQPSTRTLPTPTVDIPLEWTNRTMTMHFGERTVEVLWTEPPDTLQPGQSFEFTIVQSTTPTHFDATREAAFEVGPAELRSTDDFQVEEVSRPTAFLGVPGTMNWAPQTGASFIDRTSVTYRVTFTPTTRNGPIQLGVGIGRFFMLNVSITYTYQPGPQA